MTGSAASAGAYLLSTPSTAAGHPIGSDPQFLATATSTVAAFEQSAIKSSGGTVTGSPVSASYTLPDAQTIEFVGYQGTFDPTTVMANLKEFGSSETSYPAGPNGGDLACANTTATASTRAARSASGSPSQRWASPSSSPRQRPRGLNSPRPRAPRTR